MHRRLPREARWVASASPKRPLEPDQRIQSQASFASGIATASPRRRPRDPERRGGNGARCNSGRRPGGRATRVLKYPNSRCVETKGTIATQSPRSSRTTWIRSSSRTRPSVFARWSHQAACHSCRANGSVLRTASWRRSYAGLRLASASGAVATSTVRRSARRASAPFRRIGSPKRVLSAGETVQTMPSQCARRMPDARVRRAGGFIDTETKFRATRVRGQAKGGHPPPTTPSRAPAPRTGS